MDWSNASLANAVDDLLCGGECEAEWDRWSKALCTLVDGGYAKAMHVGDWITSVVTPRIGRCEAKRHNDGSIQEYSRFTAYSGFDLIRAWALEVAREGER